MLIFVKIPQIFIRIFKSVAKNDYWYRHVCPPSLSLLKWKNATPTGRTFFDVMFRDFNEIVLAFSVRYELRPRKELTV